MIASLPTEAAIRAEQCRRRLAPFVKAAWQILHPARLLEWGWYLDAICLHMEAVRDRRIRRLLISLPPNTLKSTIISVCYPAWRWVSNPETRFLFGANASNLATRDAMAMRELVTSPWYQSLFRPAWSIKEDQDEKTWFDTTIGGHRISQSVGDKVTGKKGDEIFGDDVDDAKKVRSQKAREGNHSWFGEAFSGRAADEISSPLVVCGQRLHKEDLIGHLLKKGDWEYFHLSEEYDPAFHCRTSVWSDPRTTPGEWMRPTRFREQQKKEAISRMGSRGYTTQYLGRPQDAEGEMFRRAWFRLVKAVPRDAIRVRYWDLAHTDGGGCFTAGPLLARTPQGIWFVESVVKAQHSALDRDRLIQQVAALDANKYGYVITVIEQEPAGGKDAAEALVRLLAGYDVRLDPAQKNKALRAQSFAAQVEAGNVFLLEDPAWNEGYLVAADSFPDGDGIDEIDATAGAFNYIAKSFPLSPGGQIPQPPAVGNALSEIPEYAWR